MTECNVLVVSLSPPKLNFPSTSVSVTDPPYGPMGQYLDKTIPKQEELDHFLGLDYSHQCSLRLHGNPNSSVSRCEAQNPRKNIPIATEDLCDPHFLRRWRFRHGLIVPRTDPLSSPQTPRRSEPPPPPSSLPHSGRYQSLNHVITVPSHLRFERCQLRLVHRLSYLYGLAVEGKAPAIFKRVNRLGVPYLPSCLSPLSVSLFISMSPPAVRKVGHFQQLQLSDKPSTIFPVFWFGSSTWFNLWVRSLGCASFGLTC